MNSLLNLRTFYSNGLGKYIKKLNKRPAQLYATQTAVKVQDEKERNKELIKEFERISNISIKVRTKKPQKPPFVKNLHIGVFDTDVLAYSELEKDNLESLNKELEPVKNYFNDITQQSQPLNVNSDFAENLKNLKLFGLQGSQLLNARELNVTESCRFNDVLANNTSSITALLSNDLLGFQALIKNGTDEHKKKYLPQLISGKTLSAFCMLEDNLSDSCKFETNAILSKDKKAWIINGEKSWVVNGSVADLFLVMANTEYLSKLGIKETRLTAFLVEKGFGNITSTPCETLGIEGTDVSNVKFNNVSVPVDNILGKVNGADAILTSLLTEFRLSSGSSCSGILRKLMNNLINYCTHTNSGNTSIAETDYVQSVIANITLSFYATESVTYLTAGLLDQYENQDCQAESAITKVFSTEQTCASISKCMELIGPATYMKDHWCNVLHRDALAHLMLNETNNNLKMSIALLGLQHAGLKIQDTIKMVRNPLFYPSQMFKRMWSQRRQINDNPKLTLNLADYVHPSAVISAEMLEYCVLRLQFATETLLARYGPEVINKHIELKRLAECAIDIYVMTACLAHASRSYCIGLQNADYEMLLAGAYCINAMQRVKIKVNEIYAGPYATNDDNNRKIARRVFHFKKYFPEHPLTRNF